MHWRLNDLDRHAWDMAARDAPFEQSWSYGAVAATFGARICRWRLVSNGQTVAVAQGIERGIAPFRCVYLPRGVHCGGPVDIAGLRSAIGPSRFILSPDAGRAVKRMPDRADLVLGRDMRAGLSKKWRNRLNSAERADLTVRRIDGLSGWLLRIEGTQRRARGYRALPTTWLERLATLEPGSVETYLVWRDGVRLAGMTFLRHGRQLHYHLGATTDAGRAVSAHNLALWSAMATALARGDLRMDLGLIDRRILPGLTRFKLGTGADTVVTGPMRLLAPWSQANDGSHRTMAGNATRVAMVSASATKNGMTPLNTS